jgi:uncharacterized protein YfiM (DUF2279 family)
MASPIRNPTLTMRLLLLLGGVLWGGMAHAQATDGPLAEVHETARPDTAFKPQRQDRWRGFDKVQHTSFSFLSTLGSQYTLVNKAGLAERKALPLSLAFSAGIGLGKELYDWKQGRHHSFSKRDLAADGLGLLLAAGLILL